MAAQYLLLNLNGRPEEHRVIHVSDEHEAILGDIFNDLPPGRYSGQVNLESPSQADRQSMIGAATGQASATAAAQTSPTAGATSYPAQPTMPDIPEQIFDALGHQRDAVARELVEELKKSLKSQRTGTLWLASREAALFSELDGAQRTDIAKKTFTQRLGIAEQGVAMATELVTAVKWWRYISIAAILIFVALIIVSVQLISQHMKDNSGLEFAAIIFALALFCASPATLLLLQRPLKGLDEWSPSKATEEKKAPASTDTTQAGTATTTPATTPAS